MKPRQSPKSAMSTQRRVPMHELFPQPGVYRPQSFYRPPPRRRNPKNLLWGVTFLCGLVLAFALFGWLRRPHLQDPYVLVEIRALEENGHPVAAARVAIDSRTMGVTDSFGEWRRYLRLRSGSQLAIELQKPGQSKAQKLVRVPSFRGSDKAPEIRVSIELKATPHRQPPAVAQRPPPRAEAQPEDDVSHFNRSNGAVSLNIPKVADERSETAMLGEAAEPNDNDGGDTNDASLGIYFDDGLSAISVRTIGPQVVPANLLEKHQGEILQQKIAPLLASDLQNLGLKLDRQAAWKVALQYIPREDQVGYIRAQITWPSPFGQTESTAFVAGFAKTFDETVRALSSLLRLHMKKSYWAFKDNGRWFIDEPAETKVFWRLQPSMELSDTNGLKFPIRLSSQREGSKRWQLDLRGQQPCQNVRQRLRCLVSTPALKDAPPLVGWQKRRMMIQGVIPKKAEVFVAGFQATPVGDGNWDYWGHPGSNHKVLMISQGNVIHSEVFTDKPQSVTVLRVLPQAGARQARR